MSWTVHQDGESLPKTWLPAVVAVGHKVYAFGLRGGHFETAQSNPKPISVHFFNTLSLRWKLDYVTGGECLTEIPKNRFGHTAVLIGDIIYIWGGLTSLTWLAQGIWQAFNCNILYGFDVDTQRWFKPMVSGHVPIGRSGHSACVGKDGRVMYIYGGYKEKTKRSSKNIYRLDTITMVWSLINTTGGLATAYHCATIIETKMFVLGGMGPTMQDHDSITVFDVENNCWLSTPSAQCPEESRSCVIGLEARHSAFSYNGELYVMFTSYETETFKNMCKFNPETFSWKKVEPKGKRPHSWFGMSCCMVGDHVILFGSSSVDTGKKTVLYILDLSPSLKTLCKLAVIKGGLEQSELPHDIRWELTAMTEQDNTSHLL